MNDRHLDDRKLDDGQLASLLTRLLSVQPSMPRSSISPALSYGRHRGPAPIDSRIAAVAVALYRDENDRWTIPLTLRPSTLAHHGGQISLPGGRVEAGETIHEAAIREFTEELGLPPRVHSVCGELSTQYVYASDNVVFPVVFVIEPPEHSWHPDPVEVDEVVSLPLDTLTDLSCRTELVKSRKVWRDECEVGTLSFRAAAIHHDGHDIWGATGLILDQLAQLLLSSDLSLD